MDLEWIKRRIAEKGLKQVDIANAMGINNPNKVSLSLAGKRQFKVHEMDILRGMLADDSDAQLAGARPTRTIPIIGHVAAGNWREAIQQPIGRMVVPEDTPPNAAALRIVGDSMNKYVQDGGEAIFDPDDRSLYPGKLYVVLNTDGETTFKQFQADPARLVPCSTNPDHQEIEISDGGFHIVGRVIAAYNRFG